MQFSGYYSIPKIINQKALTQLLRSVSHLWAVHNRSYKTLFCKEVSLFNNSLNQIGNSQQVQGPKPTSSLVLSLHLRQRGLPPWTSYFVKYRDIVSDQRGCSHFNWEVDGTNYHILRTGCWPYIKYHCTRRPLEDLAFEDTIFRCIKVLNLGVPCLAYGAAATFLISCEEDVVTPFGTVTIYFLYPEDKGARY